MGILLDDYDEFAAAVLPELLAKTAKTRFSPRDSAARESLAAWNYRHGPGQKPPALFDKWWSLLYRSIWADEFSGDSAHYQWPGKERTGKMIREEPDAAWFDDISTPPRETLSFLAARSFREACAALSAGPDWSHYRPVRIPHLARIDGFGSLNVMTGGCADCVNALKTGHGPSWRMVVELDKVPKGYGIYPGGQSGNPGSPHYSDFIGDWAAGRYYPLIFLTSPASDRSATSYRLQLRGK
jgi:penicillin amidase